MNHLNAKIESFVNSSSTEERIQKSREPNWIGYDKVSEIFHELESLLSYPKRNRMPNLLIIGDSNNGKTFLLRRFLDKYEGYVDDVTGAIVKPIIFVEAPPDADEVGFYNSILATVMAPFKTSESKSHRFFRVKSILEDLKVDMLVIDEIQNILAGNPRKQRVFLNVLKKLGNELKIPIVCSGTMEAFNVVQSDPQLANRFMVSELPLWKNDESFLRLLLSFEKILPLKKESNLINRGLATKILEMSDGLLGEISRILELSSCLAIEQGEEKITLETLSKIKYVPPQNRKTQL